MKNPFVIAVIILFAGACFWELSNKNFGLSLYYFFSAALTVTVAMLKQGA